MELLEVEQEMQEKESDRGYHELVSEYLLFLERTYGCTRDKEDLSDELIR